MRDELLQHGRMDNFRRLPARARRRKRGRCTPTPTFTNGLKRGLRTAIERRPDVPRSDSGMIKEVVAVRSRAAILTRTTSGDRASQRMQPHSQEVGHELYNLGHMLQGAIAYYRATGDRR